MNRFSAHPRPFLFILVAILLFAASAGAAPQGAPAQAYPPTIVFMTDFGTVDDSVPICKGVMFSILPTVRIVDLSHQVTPFSILDGARFLEGVTPYYPAGTVFVVVIDPGVGSARKAVIIESKRRQYFVLPDNGLITLVADRDRLEGAHEITNTNWMIGKALSSTFHGRDIFLPQPRILPAATTGHKRARKSISKISFGLTSKLPKLMKPDCMAKSLPPTAPTATWSPTSMPKIS